MQNEIAQSDRKVIRLSSYYGGGVTVSDDNFLGIGGTLRTGVQFYHNTDLRDYRLFRGLEMRGA